MKHNNQIMQIINQKHKDSGGHCGTSITAIQNQTNLPIQQIKDCLNDLYLLEKITIHEGFNQKIIRRNSI